MGQVLHGELGVPLLAQGRELRVQLQLPALELRHAGVVLLDLLLLLLQHGPLLLVVVQLPLDLHPAGYIRVLQVQVRARLVNEINGLVRQKAVRDIPLTEHHRLAENPLGDLHTVEALIVGGQPL